MLKRIVGSSQSPLSQAVIAGDFVFVSGQVPFDADGFVVGANIKEQTEVVMTRVVETLKSADCTLDDVVKMNVYLADARDFRAFNAVYRTFFSDVVPARTAIETRLLSDFKVEIEAIAYRGGK